MRTYFDIVYGREKLDIYLPDGEFKSVFLYFHGGGLEAGDKRQIQYFPEELLKSGIALVSANYAMYPAAKYPEFIEDAAEAVSWVKANLLEHSTKGKLFVGGSSAGGYLSQMLCFAPEYLGKYGILPTDITGFIFDAGQPTVHYNVLRERGLNTARLIADEAAPVFHVGRGKCPPVLIIVSDNDMPGRYEQTMALVATMKSFALDYELTVRHGKHCGYVNTCNEEGKSCFAEIIKPFIEKRTED